MLSILLLYSQLQGMGGWQAIAYSKAKLTCLARGLAIGQYETHLLRQHLDDHTSWSLRSCNSLNNGDKSCQTESCWADWKKWENWQSRRTNQPIISPKQKIKSKNATLFLKPTPIFHQNTIGVQDNPSPTFSKPDWMQAKHNAAWNSYSYVCLLYTSPSPRD